MGFDVTSEGRDPLLFVGVQDARRLFDLPARVMAYVGMVVYAGIAGGHLGLTPTCGLARRRFVRYTIGMRERH